jgi:uncharacterized protein YukE
VLAAVAACLAMLPASASADRNYQLRYGAVERGDIAMASNTIVTCPEGAPNCATGRAGTGPSVRNSAWVMVPIDIDSDPSTFDSSSSDLRLPAGATILYAGLYWGSDTMRMPEGVDAPNPSARGTVKLAAPDGAGYRTITASTVDDDRFYRSRYQGFADVTNLVASAGTGTYTVANVQASTGKDQYGGWGLIVAYRDTAKPVRWLGLYDGFREFSGGDPADVPITGFRTPASGTVKADFGMLAYEGDVGVSPDVGRLNGVDLADALHDRDNYFNARITEYGQYVTTKNPNYVNQLGMETSIIRADGALPNNATSASVHVEVSTDLVMPGAMTLVSDQAASAPAATVAPAITGTARDGQTLTASQGTWSGTTPMQFAYQWLRCNSSGTGCADIPSATGATYAAGSGDVGSTLRVKVTASNVVGSSSSTSSQTAAVTVRPPANTAAPTISGTARDGQTLTASNGTWTGTAIAYSYRWMRCDTAGNACGAIASATASTYVLTPSDVGKTVRVEVTGTNSGGNAVATSGQTAVVAARPPANTAPPVITGTARDGQTLTAGDGTWTGTPTVTLTRQWLRCDSGGAVCQDVTGGTTYVLSAADVGSTIRVRVTGTNGAGSSSATSDPTAVVTANPPANGAAPTITGTARDGQTLTSTNGNWTGTATITFTRRWLRCDSAGNGCAEIANATGQTYVLTPADVGRTLRVEVTGKNDGGSTPAGSQPTAVVAAAPPANTVAPSVSGTARDAQTLTAANGNWTGTPTVTFAYRWMRCDSAGSTCGAIASATTGTYVLTPSDVGRTIRVEVTGSNGGGAATVTSVQTGVVAARAPASTAPPVISGTARDGGSLSATDGSWTGTPTIDFTREWLRCDSVGDGCVPVATTAGHTLTPADVGHTIRVRVTGTNNGGSSSATSDPTAVVAAAPPANSALPAITGTARDGQALTANDGTWTGTPTVELTRRWLRCTSATACSEITGAAGTTYTLTSADVGRTIRVEVTGRNAGGSNVATSQPTATVAAAPPANTVAPSVSGTARDGQTLTAANGNWTGTPTITFSYRWMRCDTAGNGCAAIANATAQTHALTPSDVGRTIRVEVTGSNGGGTATVTSGQTAVVAAESPANTAAPTITGTTTDGRALTALDGSWTGTPTINFTRQWQRCDASGADCTPITGATGTSYTLTPGDVGRTIRVEVAGSNGGGTSTATSQQTTVVAAAPPINTAAPTITGTTTDGRVLTSLNGNWTGTPTINFARQWKRCDSSGANCASITGATGTGYTLTPSDVGRTIRVEVTGSNAGGGSSATSERTAVVAAEPPANGSPPAISGVARDAEILTAQPGAWTGTAPVEYAHQWLSCNSAGTACAPISGATASTYELTPGDVGHTIRVAVTGTNRGGAATVNSAQTAVVVAGPPVNSGPPSVSGTARDGQALTAADGSWTGTPTITYTYRWRRCDTGGTECANIPDATGKSYALTAADVGHTIRVRVTAANGGGQRTVDSDPTGTVAAIPPSNGTRPQVSGTTREGEELVLTDGAWSGSAPFTYTYGWERCDSAGSNCAAIPGATAARYTLTAADSGSRVRGVVTAANPGGSAPAASDTTAVVAAKPPPEPPKTDPPATDPPNTDPPQTDPPVTDPPVTDPPVTDPPVDPAPAAKLAADQWKSSTGTGLRLRLDTIEDLTRVSYAIPSAMLPRRGDAGRAVGRITVYPRGASARTWTLREPRSGSVLLSGRRIPRVDLVKGGLRVTGVPAGVRLVKLTIYTRDATNPRALLASGREVELVATARTASGALRRAAHRLRGE